MREPDFFIVGAPKCGTSALAEYLREHPDCFMCWPKEPLFFCHDLPGIRRVESWPQYLELFSDAPADIGASGEASAMYLYSQVAIPQLLERFAAARLIVMLRSPIELVQAFHAQLLYALTEDQPELATAWQLQAARASGESLPPRCDEPSLLQYREVARLGHQVGRLLEMVPREQLHFVVFDDLAREPRRTYQGVLDFLGLRDEGKVDFLSVNARRTHRLKLLSRLTQRPPVLLSRVAGATKRVLGLEFSALDWLRRANTAPAIRSGLPGELHRQMVDTFAEDIELLSTLVGRDFSPWLMAPAASRQPMSRPGDPI